MRIGINRTAMESIMNMIKIEDRKQVLDDIEVMERAVLDAQK